MSATCPVIKDVFSIHPLVKSPLHPFHENKLHLNGINPFNEKLFSFWKQFTVNAIYGLQ